MLELYILGGFLLIVIAVIPLYFVGAALYQRKQNKENANKKKVYISDLVITYCGVGPTPHGVGLVPSTVKADGRKAAGEPR